MFLDIFRKVAISTPRRTVQQLRESAFARHGAPPLGGAKELAESIKAIHKVDNFKDFLATMGLPRTTKEWFCKFLKDHMKAAIRNGYCGWPLSQGQAMYLRREKTKPNISKVIRLRIFF
ncbi:hypothetical protein V8E51_006015 [Hyaloscypha variabilis]